MSIFRKNLPFFIILLLTGCTTAKLVMKVDTALEANATVYKVNFPGSLADKISDNRLNISFGPYQVIDADVSWAKSNYEAENPNPMFQFKDSKQSGHTTTTTEIGAGPTSLFGFSRPAAEGEPSIKNIVQTVSYKFKAGQEMTWNAQCIHRAEKRITQYEDHTASELLESNYTCQYTAADKNAGDESSNQVWTLSIGYGESGTITMTQKGKSNTLAAHSTGGIYVKSDGQPTEISTAAAGYTWSQTINGNKKDVAAISVREEIPRVWLLKDNSDTTNHILAMANAGLLIYGWAINH